MSFDALVEHLRRHALLTDGPYTLRSGKVASWYVDARRTTLDGEGAGLVGRAVLEVLDPKAAAVGGMTMGADPIAVATALIASERGRSLRAFSIRKEEKTHGTGGRLVGPVEAGDAVTILEDTTTTGGAVFEAVEVARGEGLEVLQVVVLVDRSKGLAEEKAVSLGVPFVALTSPEDLGMVE
ncbi:MAG: orotate phosphoribosyltransferase [Acidimicrobiia bacterium]